MPLFCKNVVLPYGKINFYLSSKIKVLQTVLQVTRQNQKIWNFYCKWWHAKIKILKTINRRGGKICDLTKNSSFLLFTLTVL